MRCACRNQPDTERRRPLLERVLRLAALASVLAVIAGCGTNGTDQSTGTGTGSSPVLGVGTTVFTADRREQAPILVGTTLDGKKMSLNDNVDGHVVVLNVWASWCAPCRDESPALAGLATSLQGAGVRFVGINEHDTTSAARTFVAAVHSTYPHFADKDGLLLRSLRILPQTGIPSSLVLDRHGRMAARVIGPTTSSALQHIVNELLQEV